MVSIRKGNPPPIVSLLQRSAFWWGLAASILNCPLDLWNILNETVDGRNPAARGCIKPCNSWDELYLSTGAGFLLSTGCQGLSSTVHRCFSSKDLDLQLQKLVAKKNGRNGLPVCCHGFGAPNWNFKRVRTKKFRKQPKIKTTSPFLKHCEVLKDSS